MTFTHSTRAPSARRAIRSSPAKQLLELLDLPALHLNQPGPLLLAQLAEARVQLGRPDGS